MIPDRTPSNIFKDVEVFLKLSKPQDVTPLGAPPKKTSLELVKHLIDEEVNKELLPNLQKMIDNGGTLEQMVQFLDDALDSIWVIAWGLKVMSLPCEAGWNELTKANMSKFPLVKDYPDGILPLNLPEYKDVQWTIQNKMGHWVLTNEFTGKVMKPANFIPPNMFEIVHKVLLMQKLRTMPDVIADPFMKEYFHEMEGRIDNESKSS